MTDAAWMEEALRLATQAEAAGEVPVGVTSGDLELSALAPGASFDVRVTVSEDGTLNLQLL